jgi:hypothetical protein
VRSFGPRAVGRWECRVWETYYRREWFAFLWASVSLVRAAFGMSWPRTLVRAWLVLRANQVWAPYADNDPEAARRLMTRFYQLLRKSAGEALDPTRAAQLEVEWWRVHREVQHRRDGDLEPVAAAHAAALRAEAMDVSDRWVERGSRPDDPDLAGERALLVRSYAALFAAVHR